MTWKILFNCSLFLFGVLSAKGQDVEPSMRFLPTSEKSPKGTVLLIPGNKQESAPTEINTKKITAYLHSRGYDVVLLGHSVTAGPTVTGPSLKESLRMFRLLKTRQTAHVLRGPRLDIMGITSGGSIAAETVQRLDENEQPDDLLLLSPAGLNETLKGTVIPAIMPPLKPSARLLVIVSARDSSATRCSEYAKTWKGYDGLVTFRLLPRSAKDSVGKINPAHNQPGLTAILDSFFNAPPAIRDLSTNRPNPAALPVPGPTTQRHKEKLALVAREKFNLILIGNSITNNFEKPEYQPVWQQFFAPRKALNLGYSGYRTENILWNIQNGELEGQSPKVVILEIGTNNIDELHYPTRHTAGQLAGGIAAIVSLLRQQLPDAKIILLRCFPGCYGGPNPTSHREILERASDEVSRLADGQHIFYCDVNHVFLHLDGSIDHAMMPDWLHPSPAGAKAWAQAMEPLLSQLMGDASLDTEIPANTAIVPTSKLEEDSYDWWGRHADVLHIKDSINPEIVLIGNSITHFWGGDPQLKYANGQPRKPNGPNSWANLFGPYRVLNLGFGWDRTQNVLWRLDHGELDGLHPRIVIIDIGTNNTSQTDHARMNTAPEIVEGIRDICGRVRSKVPGAKIIVMAIFPREQSPLAPRRLLINEINRQLEAFAKEQQLTFVDISSGFLAKDGTMLPGLTLDFTHPTDKGYQLWADAIRSFITAP